LDRATGHLYQEIGFLRTEQQRVYDHRNARGVELEYYRKQSRDIARVERFWRTQRGPVLRFMIPTWRGDMRMSGNTPVPRIPPGSCAKAASFLIPAGKRSQAIRSSRSSAFTGVIDPYQLSAVQLTNGGTRLVATQNVSAHTATSTIVSHLLLARFSEAKLEWVYTTPYLATTKIKFVELPHEYANPPAALPEPAYLFIFTEVGVRTDRFTSYENTIRFPPALMPARTPCAVFVRYA
jgi:hypothetical protein